MMEKIVLEPDKGRYRSVKVIKASTSTEVGREIDLLEGGEL
jgi:hypothetical protein